MFKKYEIKVKSAIVGENPWNLTFYVHSKGTRGGFYHQAACFGSLPLKVNSAPDSDVLHKIRYHRKHYVNRTWEAWSGRDCLVELWQKLSKCRYLDMDRLPKDPFYSDNEPKHEELREPDELFAGFRG